MPDILQSRQIFPEHVSVRNLLVAKDVPSTSEKRLIVLSEHEVASLPLHRCSSSPQALTCDECVALRDPYCAWSLGRELCVSHAEDGVEDGERPDLLQNVDLGLHERCPPRIQVIIRGMWWRALQYILEAPITIQMLIGN